jgi:benzoyl-CoA reductase/2-hydroxyglutaryl-CoA dehydratase subunit BcrC/BadD/HgdB
MPDAMPELEEMLFELGEVASHPRRMLRQYLAAGKKVVGCMPVYTPEELAHAGGMTPMGLWGGQVTPSLAGKYNPVFTCSIMRSCLEYGMSGVYDGLGCVMMPMLCDTFRGMSAGWRAGVKAIPLVPFIHPQNRTDPGAPAFLTEEYRVVRALLEKHMHCEITDEALEKSIEVYNAHSAAMRSFASAANEHLDVITPAIRHHVFKSALFMPKEEHAARVLAIVRELRKRPTHVWKGKKVILTGITAEPEALLNVLAENGVAVTGDDLAQESRQYRTPIPEGGSPMERLPMERLARQWFDRRGCSMAHETRAARGRMLTDMAKETGADGIVVCLMRFCDVEEYDYPMIAAEAEKAGLHCLCLDIDQSTRDNGQSRTKIQSFVEMGM